jgi:hypothetical protein
VWWVLGHSPARAEGASQAPGRPHKKVNSMSVPSTEQSRTRWFEGLVRDIRDGFRQPLRRPGFTALVVGTLALGLSASTAVFTYVNAYQTSFPGADGTKLHRVFQSSGDAPFGRVSYPDFQDMVIAGEGLFSVMATRPSMFGASVRHETLAEVPFGQAVSGNYFSVLQVEMSIGRGVSPADDEPGAPPAVVLSHAYWVLRYNSSPDALGQTMLLNNNPYTIVGVAGASFLGSTAALRPSFWLPFSQYMEVYWARSDAATNRESGTVAPFVKPEPGITTARVQDALDALALSLDREAPLVDRTRRLRLAPGTWISPSVRNTEASTTRRVITHRWDSEFPQR